MMEDDIKTIDDLARLIKRTMASEEDVQAVHQDIMAIREDTAEINGRWIALRSTDWPTADGVLRIWNRNSNG